MTYRIHNMWPNKSQEPTAVGAVSSAVAVHESAVAQLSTLDFARYFY